MIHRTFDPGSLICAGNELCRTSEMNAALEYLSQVNVHMGVRTALPWTIEILITTVASELFLASPAPTLSVVGVLVLRV